ncbi:protein C19orf12 homolog [Drosophila elegans]|uniref:protein C19orf12 homolog n=1 Tax=Drosophila elegans TaxID=30023 RepID=UPI0007E5DEFE|nr:protein C19orf12 homolog [Drosophila elegans]
MKKDRLVKLLCELADINNIRVSSKMTFKGAFGSVIVSGAALFIGGVLMGPVGLAVGGAVGSMAVYGLAKGPGKFMLASKFILNEMSNKQRYRMKYNVMKALPVVSDTGAVELMLRTDGAKSVALTELKIFLTKSLNLIIIE